MYFQVVLYEYVCVIADWFFQKQVASMCYLPPTCWCKKRRIERLVVLHSCLTMNIVVEAKLYCFQGHINFFLSFFLDVLDDNFPIFFKRRFLFPGGVSHQKEISFTLNYAENRIAKSKKFFFLSVIHNVLGWNARHRTPWCTAFVVSFLMIVNDFQTLFSLFICKTFVYLMHILRGSLCSNV